MTSSVAAAEVHVVQRGKVVLLRGSLAASPRINVRACQVSHRVTLRLGNCMAHFAQGNLTFPGQSCPLFAHNHDYVDQCEHDSDSESSSPRTELLTSGTTDM
jgi:hypothetical protein